jgi:hypothetical protein
MKVRALGFTISVLDLSAAPLVTSIADDSLGQSGGMKVQRGAPPKASKDEIDRAYMNCQMEVDRNTGELVGKADRRALLAEVKSQRVFCDNRKHDCVVGPQSPECLTFVDEFKVSSFIESTLKGGK